MFRQPIPIDVQTVPKSSAQSLVEMNMFSQLTETTHVAIAMNLSLIGMTFCSTSLLQSTGMSVSIARRITSLSMRSSSIKTLRRIHLDVRNVTGLFANIVLCSNI